MNQIASGKDAFVASPRHIALIGNSVPRRCGLATYTSDCYDALKALDPGLRIDFYAMDDGSPDLVYPGHVTLIPQDDAASYSDIARQIEESGAEAIWLQHEYGIFGGAAGALILQLLDRTRLPLFTTLHTILEQLNDDQRRVLDRLMQRSSQVMVMAEKGKRTLAGLYPDMADRIEVIPHGVPDRPFVETAALKQSFGYEGRKLILTFGLLAPDKGIETMIRAMPRIVADHPDALYLVLGATHPHIVRQSGESLRGELQILASELGVAANVEFNARFVDLDRLCDYLQAADVYVTPYINPHQITSGTLSYAVAMGKPVVSTPYVHATEILDDGHGVLVPFRDEHMMGETISRLLTDDALRMEYAHRAYDRGRDMLWARFAERVVRLIAKARDSAPSRLPARRNYQALAPNFSSIERMSDATGILQHSIFSVPDRHHGYCLDDNCRALMLMHSMDQLPEDQRDRWTTTYAAFVQHAWNPDIGRFRNFMRFDRSWCEDEGSEDSSGRGLWSLGVTARDAASPRHREWAAQLFDQAVGPLLSLGSPRAQAFCILGAGAILDVYPHHAAARAMIETFSRHLVALVERARRPDWAWFEAMLAYDNARLPQALLVAAKHVGGSMLVATGLETLDWIIEQQIAPTGHFRPVGSESFGRAYAEPLPFDQQPLEAQATIEACIDALSHDPHGPWAERAKTAYRWFLGQNDLDVPVADKAAGGCFDGLTPNGVNRNQGAESLLALQFSSCAMRRLFGQPQIVPRTNSAGAEAIPA